MARKKVGQPKVGRFKAGEPPPVGKPFSKGKSGNPGGCPKWVREVRETCRAYCPEAVEKLVAAMRTSYDRYQGGDTKEGALFRDYAEAILDRGIGKPVQQLTVSQLEELPRERLDAMAMEILRERGMLPPPPGVQ